MENVFPQVVTSAPSSLAPLPYLCQYALHHGPQLEGPLQLAPCLGQVLLGEVHPVWDRGGVPGPGGNFHLIYYHLVCVLKLRTYA